MMIRSMAPEVVAVDEIGTAEDLAALRDVMKCGCKILATVHGDSVEDIPKKAVLSVMAQEQMFERYVVLSWRPCPGTVWEYMMKNFAPSGRNREKRHAVCGDSFDGRCGSRQWILVGAEINGAPGNASGFPADGIPLENTDPLCQ